MTIVDVPHSVHLAPLLSDQPADRWFRLEQLDHQVKVHGKEHSDHVLSGSDAVLRYLHYNGTDVMSGAGGCLSGRDQPSTSKGMRRF